MIDSTDGNKWGKTTVSAATLAWLNVELPRLDPSAPTILVTHFPLAASVKYCPRNAEAVLARFEAINLRLVLGGHFHGQTQTKCGATELVTNACCGQLVGNRDGTTAKGYWLGRANVGSSVERTSVEFKGL